jgi:RNA polymerase sigma-70 factor (ECF subfamily)
MPEHTPEHRQWRTQGDLHSKPEPSEPTDHALIARSAQGDHEAFNLLVERYQERAYRLAWHLTRDREEAKDLSQEAFVKIYRAAKHFKGNAKFSTWFFRILMNICLDYRRKASRWRRLFAVQESERDAAVSSAVASTSDVGERLSQEEQVSKLWAAVDQLSPQQRAALLLQVQEGLSTREIAQILKLREPTVRVHLHRALLGLRARVGKPA